MKVVLANGCFDPQHFGHLLHLQAAKMMGDRLIVSVTSDASVRSEKGPSRPLFTQQQRASMIGALRCVDQVIIVDSVIEALKTVRPHVFVKGPDYIGLISSQVAAYCHVSGIEIRFTTDPKWSATKIVDELRSS